MYPELLRQAPDRSYTKAILPSDLLKQFHFVSPVHRLPSLAGKGQRRLIYSFLCVLPFSGENLALGSPQSDDCPLARPIPPLKPSNSGTSAKECISGKHKSPDQCQADLSLKL